MASIQELLVQMPFSCIKKGDEDSGKGTNKTSARKNRQEAV